MWLLLRMLRIFPSLAVAAICLLGVASPAPAASLPFQTVFKGREKFDRLVQQASDRNWKALPIGQRTVAVGLALVGTPYQSYTLEIDDRIEAASVNLNGLDCWTFFEVSLAFARMLEEPREKWTPSTMLSYIELDRYRGGKCDGNYLSRLHYLEDWLYDNDRRGLVKDMTASLGGIRVPNHANEMSATWRSYRYLKNNRSLLGPLAAMESRVRSRGLTMIPEGRIPGIESKLRDGDIIGIVSKYSGKYGTSHVGLAYRDKDGVLRFMHASSPKNYGKVVVDSRLSAYVGRYGSYAGIIVGRPLK